MMQRPTGSKAWNKQVTLAAFANGLKKTAVATGGTTNHRSARLPPRIQAIITMSPMIPNVQPEYT